MNYFSLQQKLTEMGYVVKIFQNGADAAEYLADSLLEKSIGMGGSVTLQQLGLYEKLKEKNTVFWHMQLGAGEQVMQVRKAACRADIYITSVNALSENGEIVNIDNTGNRVAAATFGCEKVYFVIGENKITPDLESAIHRARNIAAPKNAQRLSLATPCAVKGDRCYDCDSKQRICRNLSIFLKKPTGCAYEILLVEEPLGY